MKTLPLQRGTLGVVDGEAIRDSHGGTLDVMPATAIRCRRSIR